MIFASWLGKLDWSYFWHGWVQFGGQIATVGGRADSLAALIYFKKLGWLYRNWLTSLDAKNWRHVHCGEAWSCCYAVLVMPL